MTDLNDYTGTWTIDASHTRLGFVARHAMVTKVRGSFTQFEGSLTLDGTNPADSGATVTVQMASVDSGSPDRDGHLTSADFFDVEQFPDLSGFVGHLPFVQHGDHVIGVLPNEVDIEHGLCLDKVMRKAGF